MLKEIGADILGMMKVGPFDIIFAGGFLNGSSLLAMPTIFRCLKIKTIQSIGNHFNLKDMPFCLFFAFLNSKCAAII